MIEENRYGMNEEMLFRHFDGQLNDAEDQTVFEWRDESSRNQEEYDRIHLLYLDIKAIGSLKREEERYDSQEAWSKIKIGSSSKSVQSMSPRNYLKIAASVVLFIGLGWLIYDQNFALQEIELTSTNQIVSKELADGSTISLNKNSQLVYPEKFVGSRREVSLNGEAYFEVKPDPQKPFVITAQEVTVEVLGTSFNVMAYEESDSIVVAVDEGIVAVIFGNEQRTVEAGQSTLFIRSRYELSTVMVKSTGTQSYWKTRRLSFEANSLEDVISSLEEVYAVNIYYDTLNLGNCRISVEFEDESIEDILDVVATTLNLEVSNQGGDYFLTGTGCDD